MPETGPTIKDACEQFAKVRNSTVVSLVILREPIGVSHLVDVARCLQAKKVPNLDLVVHSGGGDINVVYQIAELLKDHSERLTLIVPLYAKSAAALLTLVADEIIMGRLAELGPLDPQIPRREAGVVTYRSALNPFKTLQELESFSIETLDHAVMLIISRSELTPDDAIGHAIAFASGISQPLYSKLNIEELGEYSRALAVGEQYGDRLLRRHLGWQEEKRNNVLKKLIREYPSHEYVIDVKELQELGFNARRANIDEDVVINQLLPAIAVAEDTYIDCVCASTESGENANEVTEGVDDDEVPDLERDS